MYPHIWPSQFAGRCTGTAGAIPSTAMTEGQLAHAGDPCVHGEAGEGKKTAPERRTDASGDGCMRCTGGWRRGPESNWANRICNPVHNRFATAPYGSPTQVRKREAGASLFLFFGAGDEARTRDLNLGKVALYQLSYSRIRDALHIASRSIHRNLCIDSIK